jgi:hypothetical protein
MEAERREERGKSRESRKIQRTEGQRDRGTEENERSDIKSKNARKKKEKKAKAKKHPNQHHLLRSFAPSLLARRARHSQLRILILPIPLQMLPHADRLPDERSQVLRDGRGQPLGAEDAEDGLGGDVFYLGDAVGVAEDDACATRRAGAERRAVARSEERGRENASTSRFSSAHPPQTPHRTVHWPPKKDHQTYQSETAKYPSSPT